jgi:hypothetical protein
VVRRVLGEPGGPAEAERAGDQHLVAADRDIGAAREPGEKAVLAVTACAGMAAATTLAAARPSA